MARKKKAPAQPVSMLLLLANRGNVDFDQDPDRPLFGRPHDHWVTVKSYAEASRLCREYIRAHELGMGSWAGGQLRKTPRGRGIAYVSFNGSVWAGSPSDVRDPLLTREPLYQPPAHKTSKPAPTLIPCTPPKPRRTE